MFLVLSKLIIFKILKFIFMKNFLFLFLFSFCINFTFSQNNNTNIKVGNSSPMELANNAAKAQGMFLLGEGKYKIVQVGSTGFTSLKKLKKRALEQITNFASSNSLTFKEVDVQLLKAGIGVFPKAEITYALSNSDGTPYLSKEEKSRNREKAIAELKSLKELYDLGLLTKEEFDQKSESLKKILLGN